MTRLVQAYPDEYKLYLQEEKARDEQEKKKWLDITGSTGADVVSDTDTQSTSGRDTAGTYQSNDGGEE